MISPDKHYTFASSERGGAQPCFAPYWVRCAYPVVCAIVLTLISANESKAKILEWADEAERPNQVDEEKWTFAGVPRFTFTNDDGFGAGLRFNAYQLKPGYRPYKMMIAGQAWMSTKFVQHHYIQIDWLDIGSKPLRLTSTAGFFQTRSNIYCGVGEASDCESPSEGTNQSSNHDAETFAARQGRRYNLMRFYQPYWVSHLRYNLGKTEKKLELIVGARLNYYRSGTWLDPDKDGRSDHYPFPETRYALAFPNGENGFFNQFEAGLSYDTRDDEPQPSRGMWLVTTLRSGGKWSGSNWSNVALHTDLRFYMPLTKRLTLTSRTLADFLFGTAPVNELANMGGLATWHRGVGGVYWGRGIRARRYPGPIKVGQQIEFRYRTRPFKIFGQFIDPIWVAFGDLGASSTSIGKLGSALGQMHMSYGVALRLALNHNFVFRMDLAFSPNEGFSPFFYNAPDHPY